MARRISKLEQKLDLNNESHERSFYNLKDLLAMTKSQLENKMEVINVYDQRFMKLDKEVLKIREMLLGNRNN
jgi:hypothetical protein